MCFESHHFFCKQIIYIQLKTHLSVNSKIQLKSSTIVKKKQILVKYIKERKENKYIKERIIASKRRLYPTLVSLNFSEIIQNFTEFILEYSIGCRL